ncbi:MAG TPA: ATP-binding protein, partial [Myxococcota bacterium]|nr:ATP-binding protein [Myxococcota bacterium]
PLTCAREALEVAHEVGYARLAGLADAQARSRLVAQLTDAHAAALEGVERVHHALAQLRTYGGPGSGRIAWTSMRLTALVGTIARLVGHKVRLVTNIEAERPVCVRRGQIEQVILNLVLNAHQAAGTEAHVELRGWDGPDGAVYLAVKDKGPGIAPENMERLFQPFFTTKATGTGLGLAVSRNIVRAHGGDLSVVSAAGQGATFTIRLPAATGEA